MQIKKESDKGRWAEEKSPNYRRSTHARTRQEQERGEKEMRVLTRAGVVALSRDINVSRLFMIRGTSGRTRALGNATRAPNAYIIKSEGLGGEVTEKKK